MGVKYGIQIGPDWAKWVKSATPKCTETDLKKSQICPILAQSDPIWMPKLTSLRTRDIPSRENLALRGRHWWHQGHMSMSGGGGERSRPMWQQQVVLSDCDDFQIPTVGMPGW